MMNNIQVVAEDMSSTAQSQDASTEETSADSETDNTSLSVNAENKTISQEPAVTRRGNSTSTPDSSTSSQSDTDGSKSPKNKLFSSIPKLDSKDWYKNKCFDRYWDHYQYVTNWYKKHCHVYRSLQRKLTSHVTPPHTGYHPYPHSHPYPYPHPYHSYMAHSSQPYSNTHPIRPMSSRAKKRQTGSRSKLSNERSVPVKRKQVDVGMDLEVDGGVVMNHEDGMSCDTTDMSDAPQLVPVVEQLNFDQMEMDISDEMLDFFAKTQKHRKEREAEKKAEIQKQKDEKRINIEEVTGLQKERTSDAPSERPGSRRTAEMKLLYGKGAAMIHGMETAQQMTYDRNFDVNQPRYWPNMPFRINFSNV